jgi:mRNA interferase RelE/StbE
VKTAFRESFARDIGTLRNKKLLKRVRDVIEKVEKAGSLNELPHLKKLKGEKNYYRLRIADYRIGLTLQGDTVIFVRCLDRKDIYKYFP